MVSSPYLVVAPLLSFDFRLQLTYAVDHCLGAWRATGDVNVHWNDLIHTLNDRVVVEHASA